MSARKPYRKCEACRGSGHVTEGASQLPCASCDGTGYHITKGYVWIPCDGAAHSNPYIDNCMRCAPLWGKVAVKA